MIPFDRTTDRTAPQTIVLTTPPSPADPVGPTADDPVVVLR